MTRAVLTEQSEKHFTWGYVYENGGRAALVFQQN